MKVLIHAYLLICLHYEVIYIALLYGCIGHDGLTGKVRGSYTVNVGTEQHEQRFSRPVRQRRIPVSGKLIGRASTVGRAEVHDELHARYDATMAPSWFCRNRSLGLNQDLIDVRLSRRCDIARQYHISAIPTRLQALSDDQRRN